ncbi:serine/threonine-protein kinase [Actinomadura verrucosospora]|uniref:serine/threonine-protein kinase n=1 Tax=Actinomadura verrucosospora TaxID=46165 RepID=UPI0035EEEF7A
MGEWKISGFREVRELGAGAQGRVVLARHEQTGFPVAVKYVVVGPDAAPLEALRREAEMLARVESPHVARLYQLVEGEHGAALVMEAVDGVSLKVVLAEHGRLDPQAALTVLKGSLLGLAAAHAVGVVHRDYKPANVVVPEDGRSKLIDFGIASAAGSASRSGTPSYMAPEQWQAGEAGPSADVYAATCVFYECVMGRRPFGADSVVGLRGQHLTAPVPLEDFPVPLRPLVARGLAKNPAERHAGAMEFVAELESIARAAYGDDWEGRGVRTLAAAAAGLSMLFPLAAAGISAPAGTAAAGAAAGTAGAGGAGTAGTVAAGAGNTAAGFLAKASVVKAALVVAGATAAGTVGVVTYETTRPEAAEAPAVTLAALNRTYADGVLEVKGGQYAQVKGMKNASVQTAANRALRVPLDQAVTFYKEWGRTAAARAACGGRPNLLSTTVVKGLTGPDLVSVRYVPKFQRRCGEGPGHFPGFVVTVDLRTGRALTADDVFKPASFGVAGMKRLWDGLPEGDDKLQLMRGNSGSGGFFNPFHRSSFFPSARQPESPPWAQPFFGKNRFDLIYAGLDDGPATSAFDLGRTSCYDFAIPYGKVKDLFKPEFAARLPVA